MELEFTHKFEFLWLDPREWLDPQVLSPYDIGRPKLGSRAVEHIMGAMFSSWVSDFDTIRMN